MNTKPHTIHGYLFQARMWREYAMDWDRPAWDLRRRWVERVLGITRYNCLMLARHNARMARRCNQARTGACV